jgi:hypothetical protein
MTIETVGTGETVAATWGADPASVTAIVTGLTGLCLIAAAFFALRQVVEARRAREADVLLRLLAQFDKTFLDASTYMSLLRKSAALERRGEVKDWTAPLEEDEVKLLKVLKIYTLAGSLHREGMIRMRPLAEFIAAPLHHHFRDFSPYIESSVGCDAIKRLRAACDEIVPLRAPSGDHSGPAAAHAPGQPR